LKTTATIQQVLDVELYDIEFPCPQHWGRLGLRRLRDIVNKSRSWMMRAVGPRCTIFIEDELDHYNLHLR